ncbi:hypothetical protein, partial [Brunnivagina elsteri]|uniref:hypothetical protein n=1 Tax=Brunnivagina elsteri TaxID=1247191 RepID=UPI001B804589
MQKMCRLFLWESGWNSRFPTNKSSINNFLGNRLKTARVNSLVSGTILTIQIVHHETQKSFL